MPIETIEPRRLYRQVADQLRHLMDDGEFAVGARLPAERELSESLGVSRPTVREALIALEVEGRVRIRVGSGIYVSEPPAARAPEAAPVAPIEGPFELLRAREFVEAAVMEEAARVANAADLVRLDAVLDAGDGPEGLTIALDRAFHVAVAAILGNAVIERFVGELFDQRVTPYFARLAGYWEDGRSWRAAQAEHRAIREALGSGDPAAAREALRHHLQCSQERFARSFGEPDTEGATPRVRLAAAAR